MKYINKRNYENINRWLFKGTGQYGIPEIAPVQYDSCEFIGFNYAMGDKHPAEKGVHFFLDDYQFDRLWKYPDRYIAVLKKFKYVMSPDFSLYADFPKALQLYNHYRKHWLGAYLQLHGIKVIPTICWSDRNSYAWCFDGEPTVSCVAVSSVGCMMNKIFRTKFLEGYGEMLERLKPTQVIFHGIIPEECKGNIVRIAKFQDRLSKAVISQW